MPQFAANISLLFTEWPFLDRFAAAAEHGFQAVELQFPYEYAAETIARRLEDTGLTLALLNAPPGDQAAGERGLAALPDRFPEFRQQIAQARLYAAATGARRVHVMAGVADAKDSKAREAFKKALRHAVETLVDIEVLIEPLNLRDNPGYFLSNFEVAAEIIAELGLPSLKLQYDIYHRQILHGDVLRSLEALLPIIGHVQIASVPDRHEPGTGEVDDERVLRRLDALGYQGYVGCEYHPALGTVAGLAWLEDWRKARDGDIVLKSTWRERLG
jgi:2-dehydrotetronate isomerase